MDNEHFLFFPVVVLVGLILIALSFKLIFRLLILFLIVIAIWYGLHYLGVTNPPVEKPKIHNPVTNKKEAISRV